MKKILAISGSLRKNSYNTALIKYLINHCSTANLSFISLADIPLFNQDLETNLPVEIKNLRSQVRNADALLVATPEYNGSYSGVLKNTFDWLSRDYPGDTELLTGKYLGIIGGSPSGKGTYLAQAALFNLAVRLKMIVFVSEQIIIPNVDTNIAADLSITDTELKIKLSNYLYQFINYLN